MIFAGFLTILILVIMLYYKARNRYEEFLKPIDNSNSMKKYMPLGLLLLDILKYKFNTKYDESLRRKFAELHGANNSKFYLRIHWANKISIVMILLLIILFFGSIMWLQEIVDNGTIKEVILMNENEMNRPVFGEGDRTVGIEAFISKGDILQKQEYIISLKEQLPCNDIEAVNGAVERLSWTLIKGKNVNINNVSRPLFLRSNYKELDDLGVSVKWESNSTQIDEQGNIIMAEAGGQASNVVITATIKKGTATSTKDFKITIAPKDTSDTTVIENVKEELYNVMGNIGGSSDSTVVLPTKSQNYEGVKIKWEIRDTQNLENGFNGLLGILYTLSLIAIVIYLIDNDLKKKTEKRRMLIKYEFPDFLNKLVLLINAGMNLGRALEKISEDCKKDTPLYKELAQTIAEIKMGRSEYQAYEEFAIRCNAKEITKFVSVIIQNLRKGNAEMVSILRLQSRECWEIRKSMAKKMGEEASTKLLLPMMLMLVAILMIVSLPAIMAMKGL